MDSMTDAFMASTFHQLISIIYMRHRSKQDLFIDFLFKILRTSLEEASRTIPLLLTN
jgi:hypothetical protein